MDEPLGALDALTQPEMQALIEKIWLERWFSVGLVTHQVEEAVALADRVLVMEHDQYVFGQIPLIGHSDWDSGNLGTKTTVRYCVQLTSGNLRSSNQTGIGFRCIFSKVDMITKRCLSSFLSGFWQRLVQEFLALFRFTEADARAILLAYGVPDFEIAPLESDRSEGAEGPSKAKSGRRQHMVWSPWPIPIGIHPDFISGKWRTTRPRQVCENNPGR